MGWIVWFAESLLCLASAYVVAAALYPERGVLQRLIATLILAPALILIAMQIAGIAGVLQRLWLGPIALPVFVLPGALALRRIGWPALREIVRRDARAPSRLVREASRGLDPAILVTIGGGLLIAAASLLVWIYRSWTWDPVWYHTPITYYAIQLASLEWIESSVRAVPWTISHPRNVELLAAWNCIFPVDNRLDDSSQILFGLLGAAVIAAWARDLGASRVFASSLGGAWLLLPPVYLQIWSTHVDVACGASFAAGVYFMTRPPTAGDRWMSLLALGLYLGSKMTGLFHLVVLAPWIAIRAAIEIGRAPWWPRRLGDVLLSIAAVVAVGGHKYIQNFLVTGNPLYAFRVKIPVLGVELPGVYDPASFYGAAAGESPLFFGSPGTLTRLLHSWYYDPPTYWPDVRTGGFGPVFAYLLVPAVVVCALEIFRPKSWTKILPVLALFLASLLVQAPWWPRFIMGASMASLVALGRLEGMIAWRNLRWTLSLALTLLAAWTFSLGVRAQFRQIDLFQWPRHFWPLLRARPEERATWQVIDWLWPREWQEAMHREFQPGDVLAYDDSVYFLGEYFTRDFRSRVVYEPSVGDPNAYLARLDRLNPRWVGVQSGSAAEGRLRARGAEFLFIAPRSSNALYRLRR